MPSSMKNVQSSESRSYGPYLFIIALLATLLAFLPIHAGDFGAIDFIQYWSAWKLLATGQSPYDAALLHEIQATLAPQSLTFTYSWNPPWTYTLLAPFLALPFPLAARMWLLAQVAILLFIALKASTALNVRSLGTVGSACAVLLFLPSLYSIRYGQLGTLSALAVTSFLLAIHARRFSMAGLSLIPLTVKPHLFLLCAIPGILWLIQMSRGDRRRFLLGGLGGFALLLCITLIIAPSSLHWWVATMTAQPVEGANHVHFSNWMTHTTATAIRFATIEVWGFNPTWPLMALPIGAFLLTAIFFARRRPLIRWDALMPPLLCLSLATSNYGWIFDQSVLVICQYTLLARALPRQGKGISYGILLGVVATQLVPWLLVEMYHARPFIFFAVPWALCALLVGTSSHNENAANVGD